MKTKEPVSGEKYAYYDICETFHNSLLNCHLQYYEYTYVGDTVDVYGSSELLYEFENQRGETTTYFPNVYTKWMFPVSMKEEALKGILTKFNKDLFHQRIIDKYPEYFV